MVPGRRLARRLTHRLPRLRGDGPGKTNVQMIGLASAPPTRGWSRIEGAEKDIDEVCPAYAGMVQQ